MRRGDRRDSDPVIQTPLRHPGAGCSEARDSETRSRRLDLTHRRDGDSIETGRVSKARFPLSYKIIVRSHGRHDMRRPFGVRTASATREVLLYRRGMTSLTTYDGSTPAVAPRERA